jgi:Zn-dependent peptidase ImmA (M78 family)
MRAMPSRDLAVTTARSFLAEFGLDAGMRLDGIARQLGLRVVEVNAESFDGALLRVVGEPKGTVALRRTIAEEGRKRFTLAHEIGHYLLPNQQEALRPCVPTEIESWSAETAGYEVDANTFAAEVLMPRERIADALKAAPALAAARALAAELGTSLTATLLRLVESSTFRVALVVSRGGRSEWYRVSPAAAWEESAALTAYNIVLTVLELRERVEERTDYDEGDPEELDPEDFTLRRTRWPR